MGYFVTCGGESADLDKLLSSCLVYIYNSNSLLYAHRFVTLALTIPIPLLCGGATLLCYETDWFCYIILTVQCCLVVCPSHVFKGQTCPKGDG